MINASELPVTWQKSSYSNNGGNSCIEIGTGMPQAVPVRDSKDPQGPALIFTTTSWTAFVEATKADEWTTL